MCIFTIIERNHLKRYMWIQTTTRKDIVQILVLPQTSKSICQKSSFSDIVGAPPKSTTVSNWLCQWKCAQPIPTRKCLPLKRKQTLNTLIIIYHTNTKKNNNKLNMQVWKDSNRGKLNSHFYNCSPIKKQKKSKTTKLLN